MSHSRTPGSHHEQHRKPAAPPIPDPAAVPDDTGRDDASGYGSPVLVGSNTSGLEQAGTASTGTTHGDAGSGEADTHVDEPIGSALAAGHAGMDTTGGTGKRTPGGALHTSVAGAVNGATGADLSTGSGTIGAATGGERADAGRSDGSRNSRDHDSSLGA